MRHIAVPTWSGLCCIAVDNNYPEDFVARRALLTGFNSINYYLS